VGCGEPSSNEPTPTAISTPSSTPDSTPGTPIACETKNPDEWTRVPSNLDIPALAERLGISQEQMQQGGFGPAECERAISPQEVAEGSALLRIKGIGERCLAIGFQGPPTDLSQKGVYAVCAPDKAGA
jgi:hypothetical protein